MLSKDRSPSLMSVNPSTQSYQGYSITEALEKYETTFLPPEKADRGAGTVADQTVASPGVSSGRWSGTHKRASKQVR